MDNNEKRDKVEGVDEEKVHFTRCINALRAYRFKQYFIFYRTLLYLSKLKVFLLSVFSKRCFQQ